MAKWKLELGGLISDKRPLTAQQIYAMPEQEIIIRHVCVEGWDYIGQWSGVNLRRFLETVGADLTAKYVAFHCNDDYYGSIDMATALHPQTILATRYAKEYLGDPFGYPLRLRTATKLGFKNPKWITAIEVTNNYPGGYLGGSRLQLVRRDMTLARGSARVFSKVVDGADVQALRPEVGAIEARRRTGRPHQGSGRQLAGIDAGIDHVAGTHHIAPIQEVVARMNAEPGGDLIAHLESHFRHEREPGLAEIADVARLCEKSAGRADRGSAAGREAYWSHRSRRCCNLRPPPPCRAIRR